MSTRAEHVGAGSKPALPHLLVAFFAGLCAASSASADTRPLCHVGVRLIQATRAPAKGGVHKISKEIPMTSFLAGMTDQLKDLPFTDYDTIDMAEGTVKLREQKRFEVFGPQKDRHLIFVEPHEVANGRVRTSLEWRDPAGDGLVDTTMRIVNGENVVLGTDSNENSSTIVSVSIHCD